MGAIRPENPMDAMNACAKQSKAPQVGVSVERLEKSLEELRMALATLGDRLSPVTSPATGAGVGSESGLVASPKSPMTQKIDSINERVLDMIRAVRQQLNDLEI